MFSGPNELLIRLYLKVRMFKFFPYIVFLTLQLGGLSTALAQPDNLVPNPSFEDTIDYSNGFFSPKYWDMTLGSPDYFSSSFKAPLEGRKTPFSYYGFQIPKSGIAYMGLGIKKSDSPEKREYIQVKLKNLLTKDSLYDVSFWVNLPDSFRLACEQSNIAFAFSDTMIDITQNLHSLINWIKPLNFSVSTWNPTNKITWEKISNKYIAEGDEEYIIIGNFLQDSLSKLKDVGGGNENVFKISSYYFIDEVEVSLHMKQDTLSPPTIEQIIIPNIFTPNNDGINDSWRIENDGLVQKVFIYNRWGNKIYSWNGAGGYWDGKDCEAGVYFYKIVFRKNGKKYQRHGSITLLK